MGHGRHLGLNVRFALFVGPNRPQYVPGNAHGSRRSVALKAIVIPDELGPPHFLLLKLIEYRPDLRIRDADLHQRRVRDISNIGRRR